MLDQEYIEEILIFILLCIFLVISKLFTCCSSLGLGQKHKEAPNRVDLLSEAKTNCKEAKFIIDNLPKKIIQARSLGSVDQPTVLPKSPEICANVKHEIVPAKQLTTSAIIHSQEPSHADSTNL